jgi:hypothetical protein
MVNDKLFEDEVFDLIVREYVNNDWNKFKNSYDFNNNTQKIGEENKKFSGLLMLVNGPTLTDDLIKQKVVIRKDVGEPNYIDNNKELVEVINKYKEKDGALLFNKEEGKVNHTKWLRNADLDRMIEDYVPEDFLAYDKSICCSDIGNRTYMALLAPQIHDCKSYLIKQSTYVPQGMNKIASFDKNGIAKEFFIAPREYFPQYEAFDEEKNVVAIYRHYMMGTKEPRLEYAVTKNEIRKGVSKSLEENTSICVCDEIPELSYAN